MNQLKSLMHKEMSRKEFLVTLGFGVATVVGLASLLNLMGKDNPWKSGSSLDYSAGAYGGNQQKF